MACATHPQHFPICGMLNHAAEVGRCAAQLRSGTLKESVQSSAGSQEGSHRNDSSAVVSRGWNTRKRTVKRARSPATARRSGSRAHTPGTTPSGASVVCATARPDRRDRLPRPARLRGTFSGCKRSATIDNGVDLDNEEQGAPVWTCAATVGSLAKLWPRLRSLNPLTRERQGMRAPGTPTPRPTSETSTAAEQRRLVRKPVEWRHRLLPAGKGPRRAAAVRR
jgi:hypothetical protein